MDDYAGRILADRYRLPLPPSDVFELVETRAFDTLSGQEVLVRQIPLPEVVDAEVLGGAPGGGHVPERSPDRGGGRTPGAAGAGGDPAVNRALAAAAAAAQVPDHPRLDQVFHVFAEGGSLWVVSELLPARPLAALLAERPLSPHRAAEVAADVLTALRALHAHGWTHRNITTRTVLICDDGRAILTGLAAGAAEEALCGYNPVPDGPPSPAGCGDQRGTPAPWGPGGGGGTDARVGRGAGDAPRPAGPEPESTPSPYRDQGAAGGFLPAAPGPASSGRPWPPEGFRPATGGTSTGRPAPDGWASGGPGGRGSGRRGGQGVGGRPGAQMRTVRVVMLR
ncbi:protein kinase, partial [Streptomyces sp. URMC 124]|uniref:protein kinase n=1 Tax=Streptomyces sp. URMC 124 TaxID=3423405 RepID=UPI003F1A025E